jgi:two-component system, LytTR family, sensor kinase
MLKRINPYWYFQIGGWLVFSFINAANFTQSNKESTLFFLKFLFFLFLSGIIVTHICKLFITHYELTKKKILTQIISIIALGLIAGLMFSIVSNWAGLKILGLGGNDTLAAKIESLINFSFLSVFWLLVFFSFHFIKNYNRAEIDFLKKEAQFKELELQQLRSQLNPHFLFNAMNSIRALIDEDPKRARASMTQLSELLRSALMSDKLRLVSIIDELKIVSNYLELEKIRFEERLQYNMETVAPHKVFLIPPMLLQTITENAVKHGISQLPSGGTIEIKFEYASPFIHIIVLNDGEIKINNSATGIGIENTKKRISLIMNGGDISIEALKSEKKVKTLIRLPFIQDKA